MKTNVYEVWLRLAARVNEVLKSDDVDGVVITCGFDTMETAPDGLLLFN